MEHHSKEEPMNHLNSVLIEGTLTSDPELAYTPEGSAICRFELGSTRYHKEGEEMLKHVSFFEVEAVGKQGEMCNEMLKARRPVRVVGRLRQERWVDDRGDRHVKVYIVAEHVELRPEKKPPVMTEREREEMEATDPGRPAKLLASPGPRGARSREG